MTTFERRRHCERSEAIQNPGILHHFCGSYLSYHRRLKCLVAIDLKIGEFEAAYKGRMELYLRYLEKHEQLEGENTPIGLILCTGKNHEHIELLQLDKSGSSAEFVGNR